MDTDIIEYRLVRPDGTLLSPEMAKQGFEYNEAAYLVLTVLEGNVPPEDTQAYDNIMDDFEEALEIVYGTSERRLHCDSY